MAEEQVSGARDEHYDLISVLYHATHGAWNYEQYIADAEGRDDGELASFFREVREANAQRAERAKALLAARIG